MIESPLHLCPRGKCVECDRHRRVEQELQGPLHGSYKAGLWLRLWHWLDCGGGWSEFKPATGASCCGFCGFLYETHPVAGGVGHQPAGG